MTGQVEKAAAVVLRGGLLLVVRKRGTSIFISPGGKLEPGETDEEALARELREETGLVLRASRPFGEYTSASALDPASQVRIRVYLVEADGVARAAAEIEGVAWIDAGYRARGLELGSVFGEHVVPELIARGLLRQPGLVDRGTVKGTLLVADLDGTLMFDGRPPGPMVSAALAEIAERDDARLVLATSRAPRGVREVVGPLADRLELLCCNGAVHVAGGVVQQRIALPVPQLRALVRHLDEQAAGYLLEYGDRFQVRGGGFPSMRYPGRVDLATGEEPDWHGVVKLAIGSASRSSLDRLHLVAGTGVEVCPHADGVVDVTLAGVTKAAALARIVDSDDWTVVAFGNDLNDQILLARADRAVLVGDGLPGLEAAGHVRRVAAEDEAVAAALRHAIGSAPVPSGAT